MSSHESGEPEPAWLHGHAHEPNPAPPSADPAVRLIGPTGEEQSLSPADLARLPIHEVTKCYIVSTGHGTSGPFTFGGVRLLDVITEYIEQSQEWHYVDVVSADGFGNRILAEELHNPIANRPILLALTIDRRPLTRAEGLVRLIVPSETDDALRQVKWIEQVIVRPVK